MTNYRITFTGGMNGLFTRKIKTLGIPAQEAVEAKPETGYGTNFQAGTPAKPAVAYVPAVYEYVPVKAQFDAENSDGLESGAAIFADWFENQDGSDQLSDWLNIAVEKEVKSYDVTFTLKHTATIDADTAASNDIEDEDDARSFVENNYYELDYEEDGDIDNIEVDEDTSEFIEVEWNG